jgi:hypothetical protein
VTDVAQIIIRQSNRVSDLALVTLLSLGGLVLTLALVHFGLDISLAM